VQREKANPYQAEKKRQGGPEHEYWKYRIAEHLRNKGYEIEIESPIGEGKTIDIVASRNEEKIAIEIEKGKSDVFENVRKLSSSSFSEIWTVCLNEGARRALLVGCDKLDIADRGRVRIASLKEFLQEKND